MKRDSLLIVFVGLLLSVGPTSAQSKWTPPVYTVVRTQGDIIVDGLLDEPEWGMAESVGDFVFPWWNDSKGPKAQTVAKLLWDDENLYLSFLCYDPYIYAEYTERDDPTWSDDCVELFASPDPEEVWNYYGFEINARGTVLDYFRAGEGGNLDFPWNAEEIRIVSSVEGTLNDDTDTDQSWTVEVAIPFSNFVMYAGKDRPEEGDVWRANLNRCGGKTQQQYSQWSSSDTPKPSFHIPPRFGQMVFAGRSIPTGVREHMERPGRFLLAPAYPNPFNPETILTCEIPKTSDMRLSVYASTGQYIRTLMDAERPAGIYSVVWDGTDDAGRAVASGAYLCRMEAGEYRAVCKLILAR